MAGPYKIEIVPVMDLRHGVVVRAKGGRREDYRPIETPLSPSPDPVEVMRGLLGAVPARRIYIADLDGIEGRGSDHASLSRLAAAFPGVERWIDSGFSSEESARQLIADGLGRPVIGSESQRDGRLVAALQREAVLSLDFRGEDFLGPPEILADAAPWPDDVIVMTLARVGTGSGPDLARLAAIKARAPRSSIYAAGGLSGPQDLTKLADIGVAGVLVASALHDGRLSRADIGNETESPRPPR